VAKRIGVISHLYAQPLFSGFKGREHPLFLAVEESPAQLAIKLRQKDLDGAFLSPIDYAKDYSMYRIVPEVAAISEGESGAIMLFFNENLARINTLAVHPENVSEIVLASIVLSEKFDIKPKIIPIIQGIEAGLQQADAFLAVGDEAFNLKDRTNKMDLVDEWKDITDLPYVHGVWVAREDALTKEEIKSLIEMGKNGASMLNENSAVESQDSLMQFRYDLDENASSSLTEFFRMAYYHGILKDLPDVKFFHMDNNNS